MSKSDLLLEMKNISKTFVGVQALKNVSLTVRKGTVHALMGENGAGKSTLMKILAGIHQADKGEIHFKGQKIIIKDTQDALESGISMIHQELSPVMEMTVGENIFLNREPKYSAKIINYKKLYKDAEKLLADLNVAINPKVKMKTLSVAGIQLIEIVKALSYDAEVIIMDEPTSAIADREVERLFAIIDQLKKQGKAIIYISHKMDEIFKISDDITVFRDGHHIATKPAKELDYDSLITMMVGRELTSIFPKNETVPSKANALRVHNLTSEGKFENISFELKKGEILGLTGLMGAGRTEIAEAIFGMRPLDDGEIYVEEQKVTIKSPEDTIKQKIAFITENRKDEGLFLDMSISDNIAMCSLPKRASWGFIQKKEEKRAAAELYKKLRIKAYSLEQRVGTLSGGNQQKVVLAKWLLTKPNVLILDEPTRGIDIGAKSEIYKLMSQLVQEGMSIIMISSEMPEVLGMSDRILVFCEGRLTGELSRSEATQEKILDLATVKTSNQEKITGVV
ncbi:sugar ABC transporter ATP-binding protein [Domibacillus sp. DTU_2020_1001157_1_SI_ALB_TIR_016]|nr:sugar ABC transporter ATP-binding protein [Domibacillus sp. DTU_2020_1001157_1_SI_ALB_TIR_016]WNS78780.1 sugar ABC transporter ATP-binding protein [Domibacillus sp. DTU_2020_1001157_1_SI_ALB_TIR_016]